MKETKLVEEHKRLVFLGPAAHQQFPNAAGQSQRRPRLVELLKTDARFTDIIVRAHPHLSA
jgi:hypothetical protein